MSPKRSLTAFMSLTSAKFFSQLLPHALPRNFQFAFPASKNIVISAQALQNVFPLARAKLRIIGFAPVGQSTQRILKQQCVSFVPLLDCTQHSLRIAAVPAVKAHVQREANHIYVGCVIGMVVCVDARLQECLNVQVYEERLGTVFAHAANHPFAHTGNSAFTHMARAEGAEVGQFLLQAFRVGCEFLHCVHLGPFSAPRAVRQSRTKIQVSRMPIFHFPSVFRLFPVHTAAGNGRWARPCA
jgi:hypothetical protein